jgi:glycosyltransferase involved in cell wall biosynthesis
MYRATFPRAFAFSTQLARALSRNVRQFDLVHIHSLFLFPQFAAYKAAARAGLPLIVSPCGALDPALRHRSRYAKAITNVLWQSEMLRTAAAIHFKTDEERRLASDLPLAERQVVVPNGVDWTSFQEVFGSEGFRERRLGGYEGPIILNVGRLSHNKGLDLLIQAFAQVRAAGIDALLVLVGPDDEGLTSRLSQLASSLGVQKEVVFTGMLSGDELKAALSSAAVWALPSKSENFATAVVEALAAGVPVVVSHAVNLAPKIEAEQAGVVCERTPDAFAAAISSLLESSEYRSAIGARAREFARSYDWARVGDRLVEMYCTVTGSHLRPRELSGAIA